jgi:hypothetical protein
MKTLMKNIVLGVALTAITPLYAVGKAEKDDNARNPTGCIDTGYQFDLKILKLLPASVGNKQSLYFIFNHSNQAINLFQQRDHDSSRSMYLNHTIGPSQWGALATSESIIKYTCTVSKSKSSYGEVVDCSQNLRLCEFVNVKFGLNNAGNFWFVNSSSRNGAVRAVVHYGIIPDYRKKEPKEKKEKKRKHRKIKVNQ